MTEENYGIYSITSETVAEMTADERVLLSQVLNMLKRHANPSPPVLYDDFWNCFDDFDDLPF